MHPPLDARLLCYSCFNPFSRLVVLMVLLLLTRLRFSPSGKRRELSAFANSRGIGAVSVSSSVIVVSVDGLVADASHRCA